jgi:hypothetical protein
MEAPASRLDRLVEPRRPQIKRRSSIRGGRGRSPIAHLLKIDLRRGATTSQNVDVDRVSEEGREP